MERPKYKLSFEKFGSVGHQFGNDYAELVYKVKVEDEVYHLVIRVAGVKRSTFGPKEWVVMDQSFQ